MAERCTYNEPHQTLGIAHVKRLLLRQILSLLHLLLEPVVHLHGSARPADRQHAPSQARPSRAWSTASRPRAPSQHQAWGSHGLHSERHAAAFLQRTVHVVHHLVRQAAVVLEHIVLLRTSGLGHLLGERQDVREVLVGQLVHLGRMVLGDHEAVALRGGANVEERIALVRLAELHRRDLTRDDLAEDAVGVRSHLGCVV